MTSNEYKAKVIHLLRRLIRKKNSVILWDCGLSAKDGVYFQKFRLNYIFVFLMAFFEFKKKVIKKARI